MSDEPSPLLDRLPLEDAERIDEICDDFEAACRAGTEPNIERYLGEARGPIRTVLLRELLAAEVEQRFRQGQRPQPGEYLDRFPAQTTLVCRVFDELWPGDGPGRDSTHIRSREGGEPGSGFPLAAAGATLPIVPGYEILEELGRGGMGVVYKARALRLNRIVALKMILAGAHAGPEATLRFLNEAEVAARLRHPNVVQIFGLGDHDGRPYVELEYVEGGSLARRLNGTPRAAVSAAALVEVLARAVQAAHSKGIIHRDLKPANVLLTPEGEPKIADFGLAKATDADCGLTGSNAVLGSPSYMAPEQAEAGGRSVGPAADVYTLGAIFAESTVYPQQGPLAARLRGLEPGRAQDRAPD
jgi:serine/threonine protein kinase